jgi:multisubunit Na+/H+ antiporter MnhB subunit
MMRDRDAGGLGVVAVVNLLLLAVLLAVLAWGFLAGPPATGLGRAVDDALADSGVQSRVTAVLLNYRAYDTLLECFVLWLGVAALWSLRPSVPLSHAEAVDPVLHSLLRFLVPLMVLVGGYLLWAGSNQAGGTFQAGAILGAAGVLLVLTVSPLLAVLPRALLPWGICLGPLLFLAVAVGSMVLDGVFLGYRREKAALIIVFLEVVTAGGIGLALAAFFAGGRPGRGKTGTDGPTAAGGDG